MKKALIIGGGFAGCAAAHLLHSKDSSWDIDLLEKSPFLGAGNKTNFYGGHPYTFGPRHFLTQDEPVFDYLNSYCLLDYVQSMNLLHMLRLTVNFTTFLLINRIFLLCQILKRYLQSLIR